MSVSGHLADIRRGRCDIRCRGASGRGQAGCRIPLMRNYGSDRQRPGLAEFNQANTGLLHSSLFLYWAALILVWTAASCLGASVLWRLWSRWPRSSTRAFLHIGCSSLRGKPNSCRSISARRVARSRRRAATVCAMWVQALGFLDTRGQRSLPQTDRYPAKRTTVTSVYGAISYLQSPLSFTNLRLPDVDTIEPYGASPAAWRPTR
jgi:hypothetical protein